MIQYIKRECKIMHAYKELWLGQVTVYLPPPPVRVEHIYSQMDRQHQLIAVVRNVNKKKRENITTHSQGSTVRLKSTAWDYQKIFRSTSATNPISIGYLCLHWGSKISTCLFLQRWVMYLRHMLIPWMQCYSESTHCSKYGVLFIAELCKLINPLVITNKV